MTELMREYDAFLAAVLPDDYDERYHDYRSDIELRRRYQASAFDEGWLLPDAEPGLGGRGLDGPAALAIRLRGARLRVPRLINIQGVGVVGPALRQFGTDKQKAEYLVPTLRGDEWWALGMSEPESGSDLASMRTSAVVVDDEVVLSGQKIWTTQADESRWCTLYARSDPDAPPHRGITCFVVPMDAPGIEVRQIPTASPAIETFCEVFLDNVRVPVTSVLGSWNGGWQVAMSSLEHERDMIWLNTWLEARRAIAPVLDLPDLPDDVLADTGRVLADIDATRLIGLRTAAQRWDGLESPAFGVLKLLGSETVQRAADLSLEVVGTAALDEPRVFDERMESLAATIYGGTSEVQRNIIAERTLGLPRA